MNELDPSQVNVATRVAKEDEARVLGSNHDAKGCTESVIAGNSKVSSKKMGSIRVSARNAAKAKVSFKDIEDVGISTKSMKRKKEATTPKPGIVVSTEKPNLAGNSFSALAMEEDVVQAVGGFTAYALRISDDATTLGRHNMY